MKAEDRVHIGVKRIAVRIGLGKDSTRKLLQAKTIRGYRTEKGGAWYCIESELNEDIKKIPGTL